MAAAKGFKPPNAGKGRPKGSVNKTTALLKDAIIKAATDAGGGDLVEYLKLQAMTNPGPFMALLGKVLPLQLAGDMKVEHVTKEQRDAAVQAYIRAQAEKSQAVN